MEERRVDDMAAIRGTIDSSSMSHGHHLWGWTLSSKEEVLAFLSSNPDAEAAEVFRRGDYAILAPNAFSVETDPRLPKPYVSGLLSALGYETLQVMAFAPEIRTVRVRSGGLLDAMAEVKNLKNIKGVVSAEVLWIEGVKSR